jgi:hypothetical protein
MVEIPNETLKTRGANEKKRRDQESRTASP